MEGGTKIHTVYYQFRELLTEKVEDVKVGKQYSVQI